MSANCELPLPWACCHGKGYKLVVTHFLGPLAKYNHSALIGFATTTCCILPAALGSGLWLLRTCQVLVALLRIHLLQFTSNQPQNGYLLSASLVYWKELLETEYHKCTTGAQQRAPISSGRSAHMSAYWPFCWREEEDWEGSVYPWE